MDGRIIQIMPVHDGRSFGARVQHATVPIHVGDPDGRWMTDDNDDRPYCVVAVDGPPAVGEARTNAGCAIVGLPSR